MQQVLGKMLNGTFEKFATIASIVNNATYVEQYDLRNMIYVTQEAQQLRPQKVHLIICSLIFCLALSRATSFSPLF